MNNVVTRALSGGVFVAILIGAIVCCNQLFFAGVFLLLLVLGMREFYSLSRQVNGVDPLSSVAIASGASLFLASVIISNILYGVSYLLLAALLVVELFRKKEHPFMNMAFGMAGLVYVAFPFDCMALMWGHNQYLLLGFFIFIWVGDTGAYCAGRLFGKHKMFERVSPSKTWEGLIGGFIFVLISAFVFGKMLDEQNTELFYMLYAVVVFAAGMLGDLVESIIKRNLGIKDSGKFLPGHGGVLDRMDSALLAAPVAWAFILIEEQVSFMIASY